VTDAAVLAQVADGTLIVIKQGKTRKDDVLRATRHLTDLGVNLVGAIFNDVEGDGPGYYQVGYGYYGHRVDQAPTTPAGA